MPLGSALQSTIDIDFTRAQGINSSGKITFEPPRVRVGTTIVSPFPIEVPIVNGVAKVKLVRLPAGTYHVTESIDGRARYEFNFALPIGAAATIQYEEIAPVNPVPLVYTAVRTINGQAPDPVTGNILVETGSAGPIDLDDLTDVVIVSPLNGHSLVFDGTDSRWENRLLTATDVGAAETNHSHSISVGDVSGLGPALDGKAPTSHSHSISIGDVSGLGLALDGKASSNHSHSSDQITDFESAVETIADASAGLAASARALPNRVLRIKDKSKQGAGDTYNLPNTSNAWVLFAAGPPEYTIQANVGDDISLYYDLMMQLHVTAFFDFVVVTGPTPTIQRYLGSGTTTPTFNGPSGSYPSNEQFQGLAGMLGFSAEEGDIDSGLVRIRWVIKTTADTGKIYANNNYPLSIRVANTRLSGL